MHRYQKTKIECLSFVMCPLLAPVFPAFFFYAAINSTNETNKEGSMHHSSVDITEMSMEKCQFSLPF